MLVSSSPRDAGARSDSADSADSADPVDPVDSVLDSLRGAVDPLESHHESDPREGTYLKTQIVRFLSLIHI